MEKYFALKKCNYKLFSTLGNWYDSYIICGMEKINTTLILVLFGFICFGIPLSAQEICSNGIVDHNDGYVDCLDKDCDSNQACDEFLSCSNSLYQAINGTSRFIN